MAWFRRGFFRCRPCGVALCLGLASVLLRALPAGASEVTAVAFQPTQIAADEPHLPPATPRVGPLHRGPDGKLEVIDPKKETGTGPRLCDKDAICAGTGQAYPTLAAALAVAHEGDTIEMVGGTYRESAKIALARVTLRGVAGQVHFDCAGIAIADGKSCLLLAAPEITLENMEISGAEVPESGGANGACVRNEPNYGFTLRRVICHGSQNGILSSGGTILIENSEFFDNGWSGQAHNVYFSGDCIVTVRGSTFRDARVGHEFKSRCLKTSISDSTFRSTRGSRNLDIPDGGETLVYRSTLTKVPGTDNPEIVGFAAESCAHPGEMTLKDVRIVNTDPNADIRNFDRCGGHPIIFQGVTVEGIAPKEIGYIQHR